MLTLIRKTVSNFEISVQVENVVQLMESAPQSYICTMLLAVDDCHRIKDMLESSDSKEMLRELCYMQDKTPHYPCFQLSQEVVMMLKPLKILHTEYQTEIFSKMWTKMKDDILRQKTMLSLTDVSHLVWKPIYDDCEAIICGLNSLKIELSVVRSTFGGMDLDKITEQVKRLVEALCACRRHNGEATVKEPSEESLRKIGLYNQLCDLHHSIATLNQLREKLKLTTTDLSSSQVIIIVNTVKSRLGQEC